MIVDQKHRAKFPSLRNIKSLAGCVWHARLVDVLGDEIVILRAVSGFFGLSAVGLT